MHLVPKKPINDIAKIAGGTLFGLILSIGFLQLDNPAALKAQVMEAQLKTTMEESQKTESQKLIWEAMTYDSIKQVSSYLEEERKFDYPLVQGHKGNSTFVVPQNACRNGIRIEAKADTGSSNRFEANLQVVGVDRNISRTVLSAFVDFSPEDAVQVTHYPSSFLYESEEGTVFPKYSILGGKNADKITYDVWCY